MNIKELVVFVASALVADPAQVSVRVNEDAHSINVEVSVAQEDVGRVIGKGGRVINALRTLVRVAAVREGKRATLEII